MSKKEHILEVAESLFNLHGYTAVGVDLIRDRAKVSKTSMYRHFGSKAKLIEAVLDRRHKRFEANLEGSLKEKRDVVEKLDALISWHFQWFSEKDFHGCMFMHAMSEFKDSESDITGLATGHKKWLKGLIKSVISENKTLSEEEVEQRAEAIMTFVEGMIVRAEFGDITPFKKTYRIAIQTLANTKF